MESSENVKDVFCFILEYFQGRTEKFNRGGNTGEGRILREIYSFCGIRQNVQKGLSLCLSF